MFLHYFGNDRTIDKINPKGTLFGPYYVGPPGSVFEIDDADKEAVMSGNERCFMEVQAPAKEKVVLPELFECETCGKLYKTQKGLDKHVVAVHEVTRTHDMIPSKEEVKDANAGRLAHFDNYDS